MKRQKMTRILAMALFPTAVASAQQEPIEIVLDDNTLGGSVTAGESVSAGEVTMTVTDVVATDGSGSAAVDDFGILFGTETVSNDLASIGVSFNVDVSISAYVIGSREDVPEGMHFTVTGAEGASGENEIPSLVGFSGQGITLNYKEGNLPVLKAGQSYTISHNLLDAVGSDPLFNLESLFVTPLDPPQGIYIGSFSGQTDNGGFAMFVADGSAEVVGFNTPQDEGVFVRNLAVAGNGQFSGSTAQGGTFVGTAGESGISGTFESSDGAPGSFSGTRKADDGSLSQNAGFYEGSYQGAVSGSCFAVLASDGTTFFYVIDDPASPAADGDGGGEGTVSATTYQLSATVVPSGIMISGTLDPNTNQISGTYSSPSLSGTFSMSRTRALPMPTGTTFDSWPLLETLPADRREPEDRNGPLDLPNILAFSMGIDPLNATPEDLPAVDSVDSENDTVTFQYRRATGVDSVTLIPMVSESLVGWQPVDTSDLVIRNSEEGYERVEFSLPAPLSGTLFMRLEATVD